jgi:CTP:molybdopterin cytidylyltransferase MocA
MIFVVLAAGASRRMGFAKVFTSLAGASAPLERIAALLEGREAIAVVPPDRHDDAARMARGMRVATNAQPERGMAYSLRLGLSLVPEGAAFGVLLGDKPFLKRATLDFMENAFEGFDVAYPISPSNVPGHPVLFSARCRGLVERLPDGDSLAQVRDDPALLRNAVRVDDPGAYLDLDEPAQWSAARNA